MKRRKRVKPRTVYWALFALALALRLFYLIEARDNPFFQGLGLDSRYYDKRAVEILDEGLIGSDAYFMGPLYPHMLALVYAVAGRELLVIRVLQAILSALVPVLLFRMGRRLFDPTIALVAGIGAALYGPFIFYTGSILYTTVAITLILWILDRLTTDVPRVKQFRFHLLTGILFGLAAVGKGNIALFAPVAGLALMARESGSLLQRVRPALALALGLATVIGLVTVRNYASSGDLVFLTSNGGLNFYIGNGPESSGAYEKPYGLDVDHDPAGRRMLEEELGRSLTPTEVSKVWSGRALAFIRAEPGRALDLLARKTTFFFSTFEIPQIESYHFQKRYSHLIRALFVPFGVLAPLAVLGVFLLGSKRAAMLVLFLIVYTGSIVLFFVLTRYRLPVVPVVILFASGALVTVVRRVKRGNYRSLLPGAAAALAFAIFCNVNWYGISAATGDAQSHYRLGIIASREGRTEDAIREYRKSIDLDPNYAKARLNLGEIYAVRGDTERAAAEFRAGIALDPGYAKPRLNLGLLLYRTGSVAEGEAELLRAVELDPGYAKAWAHLAVVALLEGREDGVRRAERALSLLSPDDPFTPFVSELRGRLTEIELLAKWRARKGESGWSLGAGTRAALVADLFQDVENIEGLYREAARDDDPAALYYFGAYLYRKGGFEEASAVFARAATIAPDMPYLHFAIGILEVRRNAPEAALREFRRESETNPAFLPAWKNAAFVAAQIGRAEEAQQWARAYLERGGTMDSSIRSLIE
ncbi:MAG: tetratricopeptide repeat protein [Gemmatimonadetes bacterium]|nr:tetratricopeptide repeat protein [Gemmatimonadota bacterium]